MSALCNAIAFIVVLVVVSCVQATLSQTIITISGASSGATMATQMHFAFSNEISGCAVLAGPPYYCAGNILTAAACMTGPVTSVSVPVLERQLKSYEKDGSIDRLANIKDDPVYIFSGKYDPVALPGLVKLNEKLYLPLGANLKTNYDMPATHGFPTETFGGKCAIPNLDTYINNCNFSLAYDLLNHLHGNHLIKPESGFKTPLVGQMILFDQEAFMYPPPLLSVGNNPSSRWIEDSISLYNPIDWGWPTSGLFNWTVSSVTVPIRRKAAKTRASSLSFDNEGFVYFPSACTRGQECSIHVALHGCKQGKAYVDDVFVRKAGYLEVAELNNLIVIFPQVRSSLLFPMNPMGCWDWWGYTKNNFATKNGPQMSGVKKMIDTVRMINRAIAAAVLK
ncbi:unnamed protein product [Rotaria sp. Silwood2]|nr:unnamed protein product [Rotaria sp. Silwood2]CAF2841946.1 unnamed protein product [Rotaria sp. Silwood2]CAF3138984.1 unnamed protein product [Rotaria sp. Silwood2]CAF3243883.1 unnamed protein product [Rotaria sp. Silwood2]CAF3989097.1 unnamed protein product [Rotaria sp. Silwood2]